jgi:hypothetical protein
VRRLLIPCALGLAALSSTTCTRDFKLPLWNDSGSKVTSRERESIKKCGTGELTTDGANVVTRQPYLQSTSTTSTIVVWGTTQERGAVVVREPGDMDKVLATIPAVYAGDATRERRRIRAQQRRDGRELAPDDIYLVKAEVTGLEPGHLYCYQVVYDDGRPLTEPAPFVTAALPSSTEPVYFVALGDTGTGSAAQTAIARRMSAERFDFMLFLGDTAYMEGTARELQANFFNVYRDYMKFVPVYPAIGNHERLTRQGRPYLEAFVLPEPERFYSFDWGPIHFVSIDTTQRDIDQLTWLEKDLSENKRRWTIVFGHHAPYSNALRGAQVEIRRAFANIFTRHKVDLVLNGHEHHYERFRIADVNYIVSGGGGGQLHKFGGTSQALKQATVHHFLAFEVTDTKLVMRVIDIEGQEVEKLQLDKDAAQAEPEVKVDDKPDPRQNPVPPEKTVEPDPKLHDEPDDDTKKEKLVDPKTDPKKI